MRMAWSGILIMRGPCTQAFDTTMNIQSYFISFFISGFTIAWLFQVHVCIVDVLTEVHQTTLLHNFLSVTGHRTTFITTIMVFIMWCYCATILSISYSYHDTSEYFPLSVQITYLNHSLKLSDTHTQQNNYSTGMPSVLAPLLHHTEARQQQQRGKSQLLQRLRRPTNTPSLPVCACCHKTFSGQGCSTNNELYGHGRIGFLRQTTPP